MAARSSPTGRKPRWLKPCARGASGGPHERFRTLAPPMGAASGQRQEGRAMSHLDAEQFKRIGEASNAVGRRTRPLFDRLFGRFLQGQDDDHVDWGGDADRAVLAQEPLRARALLRSALVVFVLLLAWAGFAEIDEVTRGEGRVIPSSQLQVLQSFDGGVVEEILVKE